MKRIKVICVCAFAAFAISAMVAASAQAATLHGPIHVESLGEGEAELGNSVANIRCVSHTAHSDIVGPTEANKVVSLYKGCKVVGKSVGCQSAGKKAEEIE